MNYEEKYKKSLKVIESLYNVVRYQSSSDALFASQTIEKAFPELKESEDERIKKEIIQFLQLPHPQFVGKRNYEEWIAWLEKQDKQKPTPKYKIGDCIEYRGEKYKITNVTVTDNNFYYDVSLIKEPSDYGEVVAAIGMAAEEKMFKIEQEPTWSEEEEEMIDFMIEFIESLYWRKDLTKRKDEVLSWLESIKDMVQPKQEWSEENKKRVDSIISSIEYCSEQYPDRKEYAKDINWLKSLKSQNHWKPSEEQMEALFEAKLASTKNREYFLGLLYEDLKKL